jgi:tetratricopeptide (TPR) repeat protein
MKNRGKIELGPPALLNFTDIINFYRFNWTALLLIAVVAIIAYAAGLNGQFLSADDIPGIVQNPRMHDFPAMLKSLNITSIFASAAINIFGVNPVPFHVTVLFVHILNSYLVLLLAFTLLGKRPAFYAALIFCLLPSGSEAVFWIAGMGYVFQAFFTLLCLNFFFLYRSTQRWRFLIASTLTYVTSLILIQLSWMLIVPFVIVALDLFVAHPIARRSKIKNILATHWHYALYFLSAGAFWLIWIRGQFSSRVTSLVMDYYFDPGKSTPLLTRLPYTVYKTAELYVFPWRLSFFHEEALSTPVYAFMATVTVVIGLLVVYLVYRRSQYAGFLLAIVASIAPIFSPVQVAWFIAERYLYLGGAFFAMILSLVLIKLDYKYSIKNLAGYLLAILLLFYSVRLITRAVDFKSSKNLWVATQRTAPTSYRVYNNLGDVYSNEQDWEKAVASFTMAIKLAPDYADAIHNLGYTYMLMGDLDNAKKYLLEAYQKNNRLWQALEKLGQIELKQGNTDKAKEYFEEVRKLNPAI